MQSEKVRSKPRIKKGDTVMVMTGKSKGKTGKVLEVKRAEQRIFVEKLNIIKRHMKPSQKHRQGGIIEMEGPIQISNVLLVCANCGKPARTGYRTLEDGNKMRFCKKCGEIVDRA